MNKPIQINISGESKQDFLNSNKFFLWELKKYYDLFKKDIKEFNQNWSVNSNEKFSIIPEKTRYLSPITIIDGDWGTGKTYFIETLIKNCSNFEIELKSLCDFDKIVVIDLWEYINNNEMINDIVYDIYNKLVPKSKKWQKLIKNIFKNSLKASGILLWNIFTKDNLGLSFSFDKKIDKSIKKVREDLRKISPTIIIFDNIERIDIKITEIIKLAQKISSIDNLLIIFIMNKKKFDANNKNIGFEKYITLGKYFKFSQDYKSFLISKNINDFYANDINLLLKTSNILNNNISIRELEKKLYANDLNKYLSESKYNGYFYIDKYVWQCEDKIKEFISNDVYKFIEYIKEFSNIRNQFINNCKEAFPKQPNMTIINYNTYNTINNYNTYNNIFEDQKKLYDLFYTENTNIKKELEKIKFFFDRNEFQTDIKIFINYEKIINEIEKILENKKIKKNYKNIHNNQQNSKVNDEIIEKIINIWSFIQKSFNDFKRKINELKRNLIKEIQFTDIFLLANNHIKNNNHIFDQVKFVGFIFKNYSEEKYE